MLKLRITHLWFIPKCIPAYHTAGRTGNKCLILFIRDPLHSKQKFGQKEIIRNNHLLYLASM